MTSTYIKSLVSKKKKRYIDGEFNLDLTYISDRIIAMGFPSENLEAMYRNSMDDVVKLLEMRHKDRYKIYNLCSERSYDISKFHSRVSAFPFDDHNPPEFRQIGPFCEDVDRWLEDHPDNVAVVHCKAGKGRTGLMICAYLLHSGLKTTASEVLEYYAKLRTQDQKGVTIPSQKRYVDYYSSLISNSLQYNPVKMYLTSIVIDPLPNLGQGRQEGYIQFEVRQTSIRPYISEVYQVRRSDGRIIVELPQPILIVGDVKIEFIQKIKMDILNLGQKPRYMGSGKLFHFWVNTFFIDQQRSSPLSHSYIQAKPTVTCPSPATKPAPQLGWPPGEERNSRSAHNSGGTLGPDSPLPPPRMLRHTLSDNHGHGHSASGSSGSMEDQSEEHSPTGSCLASCQTIHSHPPAKTVSIVDHYTQVGVSATSPDQNCDSNAAAAAAASDPVKNMSCSDDSIMRQSSDCIPPGHKIDNGHDNAGNNTTHKTFNEMRKRHSSVPQTARIQGPNVLQTKSKRPPGRPMSVRLTKNQIDKASKDKSGKFNENFNVTLFLVRPNDQILQEEFSRSNIICQRGVEGGMGACNMNVDSSEDSSEEESAELRQGDRGRQCTSDSDTTSHHSSTGLVATDCRTLTTGDIGPAVKTLSAHLPSLHVSPASDTCHAIGNRSLAVSGMVRNHTEPNTRLSEMTAVSQSTWI